MAKTGTCQDCGRIMKIQARGLCASCYDKARRAGSFRKPGSAEAPKRGRKPRATRVPHASTEAVQRIIGEVAAAYEADAREAAELLVELAAGYLKLKAAHRELRAAVIRTRNEIRKLRQPNQVAAAAGAEEKHA